MFDILSILYIILLVYIKGYKMLEFSVGELQKKPSIFSNMSESFKVVDRRKNKALAIVNPIHVKLGIVSKLGGSLHKYAKNVTHDDIKKSKISHYMEKYNVHN